MELQGIFSIQYRANLANLRKEIAYYSAKENREQIKHLTLAKREIATIRTEPLLSKILCSDAPNDIKNILYERYNQHCSARHSEDAHKNECWINYVLALPHKKRTPTLSLANTMATFNKYIYGMTVVKEEIMGIIANNNGTGKIFGMIGSPGVGKTLFARGLSEALGLPLQQISLGGATDAAFLEGHGFTYTGSEPGMIAKSLMRMKCTNGIFFIDEVEKTSKTNYGKELEHSLLHILDFTQNSDFRDKYMPDIPIDLSSSIFILSMNSTKDMDSALISRIPLVHVEGYTTDEKIIILQKHLLPEILDNYKFRRDDITINKSTAKRLIYRVKEEGVVNGRSGVRALKYALDRIVKYLNMYKLSPNTEYSIKIKFSLPFEIDNSVIDKFVIQDESSKNYHYSMYI
jgi:ATP-dependent Lon protease